MKTDFLFRTAKLSDRASQRLRSHQDETRRGQHLARGGAIVRFVEVDQHVRAMERNHRRRSPVQDERQEMDRDVPEINVEQLRLIFLEQMLDLQDLAVRNLPGRFSHRPKPEPPQEMRRRFSDDKDRFKRKPLRLLALLRDDHRPKPLQRGYLPVNVQHLRLEKRRAIAGDDRRRALGHA